MKMACDADFPCETCLLQGATCTVNRIEDTASTGLPAIRGPIAVRLPTISTVPRSIDTEARSSAPGRGPLSFLLNYVHPDNTSLASAFGVVAAAKEHSPRALLEDDGSVTELDSQLYPPEAFASYSPGSIFQFFLGELDSPMSFPADIHWSMPVDQLSIGSSDPMFSPLQGATNKVLDELTHFSSSRSQYHMDDCPHEILAAGLLLFTASKISALVDDYFLLWNHHSPIIHGASFNISTAHTPLLLAVCLTSALLDPNSNDASAARGILDLAEEYIFAHRGFQKLFDTSLATETPPLAEALPAVQAAFSIAQIQLRQGSQSKRESIRDYRFDQLILALKYLGLHLKSTGSLESLSSKEDFDWAKFGLEQAGARLLFGIYNLDVSFSTLYDKAPRLFVEEMQLCLPCSLDAFMATTVEACYEECTSSAASISGTLADALDALCAEEEDDEVTGIINNLNTLDLFITILAIIQAIWLLPYRPFRREKEVELTRALQRWMQCWTHQKEHTSASGQERFGFVKDAAVEFWVIAGTLIRKGRTSINSILPPSTGAASSRRSGPTLRSAYQSLRRLEKE
ncbi:hypothetical protein LTR84_009887 [Exophiala bonariae]|uniref:Xylanolytic transcriptional activator regulatory domain-containing protein n=1 Tax=Exophiala bonariae TaxID=1690606 RepID=A0AAV9NK08_9EURO|nr:hypothetical protein LTR84_009887 [Exophiala bonariae]